MATAYRSPSTALKPIDLSRYARPDPDRYVRLTASDVPKFDRVANPEINTTVRLADDLAFLRTPTKRLFADWRANPDAYKHLAIMPEIGQTLHMRISGKYALAELVPALIERTTQKIEHLTLATLGFSKQNGADLLALLDGGQVKALDFVCSYYFKSTSGPIYDAVIPELLKRQNVRVLSMRNQREPHEVVIEALRLIVSRGARQSGVSAEDFRAAIRMPQVKWQLEDSRDYATISNPVEVDSYAGLDPHVAAANRELDALNEEREARNKPH